MMRRFKGLGVSPGFAAGRAILLRSRAERLQFHLPERDIEAEVDRLTRARERVRAQLRDIKARIERTAGADRAYLFDAQLLMLDDPLLVSRALTFIREDHLNADWALQRAGDELAAVFDGAEDPYLRERKGDMFDVVGRLRGSLRARGPGADSLPTSDPGPYVLIADDLPPSIAAQVDWTRVLGFATDTGSWTYHTAILARSLGVPAVAGLEEASSRIAPGMMVVVDGDAGEIVADPLPELLSRMPRRRPLAIGQGAADDRAPVTRDGRRIRLEANLELLVEMPAVRAQGAEGIGLYRTEYLRGAGPLAAVSESQQFEVYRTLLEQMAPAPVTIRTFDIDEEQAGCWGPPGRLGLHALRLSLSRRDLFVRQLRALVRAARHGSLRIMFPFVSGVQEVREARQILQEVIEEIRAAGGAIPSIPVGVMVEVPSAVLTADLLAREVDFFSIGTNDLIQYCLAVDRTNARLAEFYEPLDPAILRAIRLVARAGRRQRVPVSLCGEMASNPILLPLLIGIGITEFSMAPGSLAQARRIIRAVRYDELRQIAAGAMHGMPARQTERRLTEYIRARASADHAAADERHDA
ncbi:MAG: phosphoenolpyruvate--protein phosphotransferase [Acidobacteria bacterium]|nr:phosphoenolpyruvate--protein phosphotransferase [Acidobacteriota bacterium]